MDPIQQVVLHIGQTIGRPTPASPMRPFHPEPIDTILDRLNARMSANAARTAATIAR